MLYLKRNGYDSDAVMEDITDHNESNLRDFIKNELIFKTFIEIINLFNLFDKILIDIKQQNKIIELESFDMIKHFKKLKYDQSPFFCISREEFIVNFIKQFTNLSIQIADSIYHSIVKETKFGQKTIKTVKR